MKMRRNPILNVMALVAIASASLAPSLHAFMATSTSRRHSGFQRYATPLPEIEEMRVGEIKQELESYGISTNSFLEKKEMIEALSKARAEGKTPINKEEAKVESSEKEETKSSAADFPAEEDKTSSESTSSSSRSERLAKEKENAESMKISELKQALKDRGIRTTTFLEKSEFVRAYAEAIVDGVTAGGGSSSSSTKSDEPYDASYRDVTMRKMSKEDAQRLFLGGGVIDIRLAK